MKSILRIVYILTATIIALSAQAQSVNESVVFDQKIHDFGTISETGGKVTHRFRFVNRGKDPVVMVRAQAGCNCVHAEVPAEPIPAGAEGFITVTFDPDYRPGHFSKEIVVHSAGKQYNRIWVKGDVTPGQHPLSESHRYDHGRGLLTDLTVINFGHIKPATTSTKTLSVANDSDVVMNLDFATESPSNEVNVRAGARLRPHETAKIEISITPAAVSRGHHKVLLYPEANGHRLSPVTVEYDVE